MEAAARQVKDPADARAYRDHPARARLEYLEELLGWMEELPGLQTALLPQWTAGEIRQLVWLKRALRGSQGQS